MDQSYCLWRHNGNGWKIIKPSWRRLNFDFKPQFYCLLVSNLHFNGLFRIHSMYQFLRLRKIPCISNKIKTSNAAVEGFYLLNTYKSKIEHILCRALGPSFPHFLPNQILLLFLLITQQAATASLISLLKSVCVIWGDQVRKLYIKTVNKGRLTSPSVCGGWTVSPQPSLPQVSQPLDWISMKGKYFSAVIFTENWRKCVGWW